MSAQFQYRDLSENEIQQALSYLDPNCSREEWVALAMAVKSELGASGFALWDEWSKDGKTYNSLASRDTWKSIKPSGGVTIATLIHEAKQFGFTLDPDNRQPINQVEVNARRARREDEERAAEAERNRKRAAAAEKAATLRDAAQDIDGDDHNYLVRKKVSAFGLRVGKWTKGQDALLVPMRNIDRQLVSLQAIFSNANPDLGRDKDYLYGGQRRGSFHMVGNWPTACAGTVICVVEGYATGATIHQATGWPCAVAFDAGNLPSVARALRQTFGTAAIVIAADNDQWTDGNPGIHHSRQAASAARAILAIPKFSSLATTPTDFNDLAALEGLDVVREQITAVVPTATNKPVLPLTGCVDPFGFPDMSDRMQPLNTRENLEWVIEQFGITPRYNIISKDVEVTVPGMDYGDTEANNALSEITSICARNRMPKTELAEYIKLIATDNRFNPVADFIMSAPWDGISRLNDLYNTLKTPADYDRALLEMLVRRWLISAVAAALLPSGFWSKGVLVLQGAQSLGKTAWFKSLVPSEQRGLIKVGATIDPTNKDSISSAIGHWMVELGELDGTFRKADIAKLKAFISQDVDQLRRPYDRLESKYQRRTVFFASVNPAEFLADETGNVRWWTVPVENVSCDHGIDVQQLWAEVAVMFRDNERWWLDREEETPLEAHNEKHQHTDPIEEIIRQTFCWNAPIATHRPMTCAQVLLAIGYDKPTAKQSKDAGTALQKITGKKAHSTTIAGKQGKYYTVGPNEYRPI